MENIFETSVGMGGKSYRSNGVVMGTGLPIDWEEIMNRGGHNPANVATAKGTSVKREMVKSYHLKFRGITFLVMLPYDAGEYFSDLKNITKDELRVFEVVYPDYHAKIKEAWSEAYTKVQAGIIFDKED